MSPYERPMVSKREGLVNQDLLIKTLKDGQETLDREVRRLRTALETEKNLHKQIKRISEIRIKEEVEKETSKWIANVADQKRRDECEKHTALQRQKFHLLRSFRGQLSRAVHENEEKMRKSQLDPKSRKDDGKLDSSRIPMPLPGSNDEIALVRMKDNIVTKEITRLRRENRFLESLVEKQTRAPEVELVREIEMALQAEKAMNDHYKSMLHSLLEGPCEPNESERDVDSVLRRAHLLQLEVFELKSIMEKKEELHEQEKGSILIRLNEAESKLVPFKYQHQRTLAKNIKLVQLSKEWREKALSAKKEMAISSSAKKSAIPVRRTQSAPSQSKAVMPQPDSLLKKNLEEVSSIKEKDDLTAVGLPLTNPQEYQKVKNHFRFERKHLQRLKPDLPTLIECDGENTQDGTKSPNSETSEDSGFCSEPGRKDLEQMYTHLFREHQELQRAHAATRITLGQTSGKRQRELEGRKGSESPKWDYSDIQTGSLQDQSGVTPRNGSDNRAAALEKKLERLRLRNIALESDLQDMHDQNELLEFRLLELEECHGNKRRDVYTEMEGFDRLSDSGNGSLSWSGDSSVSIRIAYKEDTCHPTFIHTKIDEYKKHLRSLTPRLTYHEDKALLHQTIAILEACQVTIDRLEKQNRNVTRIQLPEMRPERLQESGIFDDSFEEGNRDFCGQTDFEDFDLVMTEIDSLRKFKKNVEHLRLAPVLPLLVEKHEKAIQAEPVRINEVTDALEKALSENKALNSRLIEASSEVNNLLEKLGAAEIALVNTVNQLETEVSKQKALIDYVEDLKEEVCGAFFDIGIEKSDDVDIWCIKSDIEALRECLRLYSGGKANERVSIYIKDSLESDLSNNNIDEPLNQELEKFYLEQIETLQKEKIALRRSFEEEKNKLTEQVDEFSKNLQNAEKQIEDNLERLHKANELIRLTENEKCKTNSASEDRIKFLETELRQLDDFYRSEITSQKQAFLKDYEELCSKHNESQLKVNKLRDLLNDVCQELEFDMIKNPDTDQHFSSISEVLFDDSCGEMLIERIRNLLHEESALRQKNIDLERKERAYRETLQEADAIMARVEEQHKAELRTLEENERQLQEKITILHTSEKRLRSLLQEKEGTNSEELMFQLKSSDQLISSLREQLAELEHVNAELNFKLIEEQERNQIMKSQEYENSNRLRNQVKEYEEMNAELDHQVNSYREASRKSKDVDTEVPRIQLVIENLEHQIVVMKRSLVSAEKSLREEDKKLVELSNSKKQLELEKALLVQENQGLRENDLKKKSARENGVDMEEASLRAEISKMRNQQSASQSQMQELESINCTLREDLKRTKEELRGAREMLGERTSGIGAETQTEQIVLEIASQQLGIPVLETENCPNCIRKASTPRPHNRLSSEEILEDINLTEKFIDDIFGGIDEPKSVAVDVEVLKAELKEKETVLEVLDGEARQLTTKLHEKDAVIKDLESNLVGTCKENERLKNELEAVRTSISKSLHEPSSTKQPLERRRATVGRSSSFSGVRAPKDRPRSVRFEPKSIEERLIEKKSVLDQTVPPPSDFKVTRRVGDDGLVVAWIPPDCEHVCGYLICANDLEVQRVRSADRTKAVLYNLPTSNNLTLTIQSVTKTGSSSKPARTGFDPEQFDEVETSKR